MENSLSFLGEGNAAEEAAQKFLDENIEIGNLSSENDIDEQRNISTQHSKRCSQPSGLGRGFTNGEKIARSDGPAG